MVVVVVELVVVVVVVVVVGFGVVLGRGVALGGAEVEGVPGKEIKWASWIILLISHTFFLAFVKKNYEWIGQIKYFHENMMSRAIEVAPSIVEGAKNVWDFLESINTSGK